MCTRKKSHEAVLGSGIFLLISGIVMLFCFAFNITPNMLITIPIAIILAGALFLLFSYTRTKLVWTFFLGYFLVSSGIFSLVVCFGDFSIAMSNLWPCYVLLCGISYLVASLQVHRRFTVLAVVPSVVLVALGIMLLCFSLKIITVSFRYFVARWWPGFLVLLGIALIIIYTYMQRSNSAGNSENEVIADSDDDY